MDATTGQARGDHGLFWSELAGYDPDNFDSAPALMAPQKAGVFVGVAKRCLGEQGG